MPAVLSIPIRRILFFVCFALLHISVVAAQSDPLQGMDFIIPYHLYKTKENISGERVANLEYEEPSNFGPTDPRAIYVARLDFGPYGKLLDEGQDPWVLQIGNQNRAKLFYSNQNELDSLTMGSFELNARFTGKFTFQKGNLFHGRYLYLKFSKLNTRQYLGDKAFLFYAKPFEEYKQGHLSKSSVRIFSLGYLLWGAVFVGVVISMVFYRTYKQPEYIYYSLYAVSLAIFLGRYGFGWYERFVGNYSFTSFLLGNTFELLAGLFYALFEKYFLNTKQNYPLLNKAINISVAIFIVWLVIDTLLILIGNFQLHFLLLDTRAVLLTILVLFSLGYLIIRPKDSLNWFIIVGSFIYGLCSVLVYVSGDGNYLRLGAVGEITVFSLGLGYKVREENLKKIQAEHEASKTYLRLLRSQLNPHFIFNALGSIQHLVLSEEKSAALHYLNKFSKLMRHVLESSSQENVLLSEEISFLEKYISLESLRFQKDFGYTISTDPGLCPDTIEVPLLVTQPFVENAIIHGLLPKENGSRQLSITFRKAGQQTLQCIIMDNGIGRVESERHKLGRVEHQSKGVSIMQERLDALQIDRDEQTIVIEDLYGDDGKALGTRVTLNFFID
ncbi:sensor histidine kinase [Flagellimonas pelagia]|nr:histidine kinase [Allomuricauda maritima]